MEVQCGILRELIDGPTKVPISLIPVLVDKYSSRHDISQGRVHVESVVIRFTCRTILLIGQVLPILGPARTGGIAPLLG